MKDKEFCNTAEIDVTVNLRKVGCRFKNIRILELAILYAHKALQRQQDKWNDVAMQCHRTGNWRRRYRVGQR